MEKITISEYRSEWNDEFELFASKIREVVGERVIRIDHIGSTAIPELAAKDVIDIQLTVTDLESESATSALTSTGYRLNSQIEHDLLTGLDPDLFPDVSPGSLYFRLPIQFLFIAWTYWATRPAA
jgi:dephospho-CoA kinase